MAQQIIDIGTGTNTGDAESIRSGFAKTNDNFTELYTDKADLASPALTGIPTAPTAAGGTNTTQIATTAFVSGKADLASPAFTGIPTAPTAAGGTNTNQLATTAFVIGEAGDLPAGSVSNAELANMATQTFKGRNTAGTGDPEDLSVATVSTMLSLGDLATQNTVNNDDWSGTDLAIANGGTGASTDSAARTNLGVDEASDSEVYIGDDDSKVITAKRNIDSSALQTLSDAANIAVDMDTGSNFTVTLGGNRVVSNPSNNQGGKSGLFIVQQDGTGGRTLTWSSNWKVAGGGNPTLSTGANEIDIFSYFVQDASTIYLFAGGFNFS